MGGRALLRDVHAKGEPVKRPLLEALFDAPDIMRAARALAAGGGPAAAFGLTEAHKSHLAAALAASLAGYVLG